eukprot:11457909-Alexandrium_andersonii.AAC.1
MLQHRGGKSHSALNWALLQPDDFAQDAQHHALHTAHKLPVPGPVGRQIGIPVLDLGPEAKAARGKPVSLLVAIRNTPVDALALSLGPIQMGLDFGDVSGAWSPGLNGSMEQSKKVAIRPQAPWPVLNTNVAKQHSPHGPNN